MTNVPLEDLYEDIIGKAIKGWNLDESSLAEASDVNPGSIEKALSGQFDEEVNKKISQVLKLHESSLLAIGKNQWAPESVTLKGLLHFNTPYPVPGYQEMTVNSYITYDPDSHLALVFDSGANAGPMINAIDENDLSVVAILITHTHRDHIADLDNLRQKTGNPPVYIHLNENSRRGTAIQEDWKISCGKLESQARLTPGHSPGGTTYVVSGLERPVAITGDALFAGSAGGAGTSWPSALVAVSNKILSLPDDTVICPGHGPMSTVAEEKAHNPLFPQFK